MALEANIVYLDEELKSNQEHLVLIEKYLKENPSVSIYKYKSAIRGNVYYYKKYWKEGKSVSEFLCKDGTDVEKRTKEIDAANEKRRQVNTQLQKLKQVTAALEKQLRIARQAYENA
jgi:hypothetical protein